MSTRREMLALSLPLLLTACGGGGSSATAPAPSPTASDPPAWAGFGGNAQHQALSAIASQPLQRVLWSMPVDLAPPYRANGTLLIHYGSPVITASNTVLVPVKTSAEGLFGSRRARACRAAWSGSSPAATCCPAAVGRPASTSRSPATTAWSCRSRAAASCCASRSTRPMAPCIASRSTATPSTPPMRPRSTRRCASTRR